MTMQRDNGWRQSRLLSEKESLVVSAIDEEYAWRITEGLSSGEMRAGTQSSRAGAERLAAEMASLGLTPGGSDGYLEEFLIYGCDDLGTSVSLVAPETLDLPCKQSYQGLGTGPAGVTAPVVYAGLGRWEDFERLDVKGKIVLLHRLDAASYFHTGDPFFYSMPAIAEASHRGAVGALLDYPINAEDALKTDASGGAIPNVYIRSRDSLRIRELLAAGQEVVARVVVQNKLGHYPSSHNVIGMIRGDRRPEEYVYLCAHFDHWFHGSSDDNAAVGSLFAVAKAVKESGLTPQRTLVFCAWDSEETGGHPDTWYEWLIGSFSHIHATLTPDGGLGPALHPERRGRIVGMLNLDQVASKGSYALVESTPEVLPLFRKAANDSGLKTLAPTSVSVPPGAYDDWSFFISGVPCGNISWWGHEYDRVYHTDHDTMAVIDSEYLLGNTVFAAVSVLRLSEPLLVPYTPEVNLDVVDEEVGKLLLSDRYVASNGKADLQPLRDGMAQYRGALQRLQTELAATLTDECIATLNSALMESAGALNPALFYWDVTGVLPPGHFVGHSVFQSYAKDLYWVNKAIDELMAGDAVAAAFSLENVTLMSWGRYVGRAAYDEVVMGITGNEHMLWGDGFVPVFTDVHAEYESLKRRRGAETVALDELAHRLTAKRDAIYEVITRTAEAVGRAFAGAAAVLDRGGGARLGTPRT